MNKILRKKFKNSAFQFMKSGVFFGALILFGATQAHSQSATEWGSEPAWSNIDPDSAARTKRNIKRDISPFAPDSHNIGINIGQNFLMGDLSSNFADSLGFNISHTYGVSEIFGLESKLGYSDHSDGDFNLMSAKFGLRTNLAWFDRIVPFVVAGMGFYRPSYTFPGGSNGEPSSSIAPILFGIHVGPGVNLQVSDRVYFGTSLTFHDIFSSEKKTPLTNQPFIAGGTFLSLLIHAGVTF